MELQTCVNACSIFSTCGDKVFKFLPVILALPLQ